MADPTLSQEYDTLARYGQIPTDVPTAISSNLAPSITLRPYQVDALGRFAFFMAQDARPHPAHLLFHMATGSGKTVIMAALILDLFARGHRNFLFFVDSSNILEKTRANFLDASSTKHLFADPVRIGDRPVAVRAVANFSDAAPDAINIHFTTIQGLHTALRNPKENAPTFDSLAEASIVLISDEAHHLNTLTKGKLNVGETENTTSWEHTVQTVLNANPANLLLEFTATAELGHAAVEAKYRDKLLVDYPLRQFNEDRYAKDIRLRQTDPLATDADTAARMLNAVVLSQYRRKLAADHSLTLKPVVLMKSARIADSADNEALFHGLIDGLTGEALSGLRAALPDADIVARALDWMVDERGVAPAALAAEFRSDFAPTRVRNVNKPEDLERAQIELNTLEDRTNPVRVVFAVDKLNEGWDVLNLFDIVRLYDKASDATTVQEAQLIGRGARYWPFTAPDRPDEPKEKRKFDGTPDHPLRVIERLVYHCSHDPVYLRQIRDALREIGLSDEPVQGVLAIKPAVRESEFFRRRAILLNERRRNDRTGVFRFADYQVPVRVEVTLGASGRVAEQAAFGTDEAAATGGATMTLREVALPSLGDAVLRHAMDARPFFRFDNLRHHFPKLTSGLAFRTEAEYLGGVVAEMRGPTDRLDPLSAPDRLAVAGAALDAVQAAVRANSHDEEGTRDFRPHALTTTMADATITLGGPNRTHWRNFEATRDLALDTAEWFTATDFWGTSEELHFLAWMADHMAELTARHGTVRLFRNEGHFALYSFVGGRRFEPDFALFLERGEEGEAETLQLFIEPKGAHLADQGWKEEFLLALHGQAELPQFEGRTYRVHGLPFFRNTARAAFGTAFEEVVD